jgi:hypothetical protein
MSRLVSFIKKLNKTNQIEIYTDDSNEPNGYGIYIDDIVLTLYHIIKDSDFIKIKETNYIIDTYIEEYDIAILRKPDKNIDYSIFLDNLNKLCEFKISNYNEYRDNTFSIMNNRIKLSLNDIECKHIVSNIFPSIPVFIFSSDNNDKIVNGLSGCSIELNKSILGLLVSKNINTNDITCISIEIIYKILSSYINNNMKFYYMPLVIINNISKNNFRNIMKNDIIYSINDININNNVIFDDDINSEIPIDTYIILNGFKNIKIEYSRNKKNNNKKYNTTLLLKEFNYKDLSLNFKDYKTDYNLNNFIFSELSEEIILEKYRNNIKINDDIYNDLYSYKKIYLKNIINIQKEYIDDINIDNQLYILYKISGKKIKNIKEIKNYTKYKNITIDLIDINMNNIKIKI